MLDEPEEAGLRVARLRARRDGADLEVAEAERGERIEVLRVLVHARGETHGIGEADPHHRALLAPVGAGAEEGHGRPEGAHRLERELVRGFGVQLEEGAAGEAVEHQESRDVQDAIIAGASIPRG